MVVDQLAQLREGILGYWQPTLMLDAITPVILTLDEEANLGRNLERLRWAHDIVVVDSGSGDGTRSVAESFPGVRFFERAFDGHASQWNFAVHDTGIGTEWVLALDADYLLSEGLVGELQSLAPSPETGGFQASFVYCIGGKPLRGSLYSPVTVLYRRAQARYEKRGHTQRVAMSGLVEKLREPIYHDDRKPASRWLASQKRYMRLEAERLRTVPREEMRWQDRLRQLRVVTPLAVPVYLLFVRGLVLDGWAGLVYTGQRALAEALLSFYLLDGDLRGVGQ